MRTQRIEVIRAFLLRREAVPVGTVLDVPFVLGSQLMAASKAVRSEREPTISYDDIVTGRVKPSEPPAPKPEPVKAEVEEVGEEEAPAEESRPRGRGRGR